MKLYTSLIYDINTNSHANSNSLEAPLAIVDTFVIPSLVDICCRLNVLNKVT